MTRARWERLLWVAATAVGVVAYTRLHSRPNDASQMPIGTVGADPTVGMFDADTLDKAAERVIARDPFRLDRHPASVAFSTTPSGAPGPIMPPQPAVRLVLHGTIGGPPWKAILSGIPGHDGTTLMSTGDTLGGVLVRRVARDSVLVRVKDSTWAVTMGRGGA